MQTPFVRFVVDLLRMLSADYSLYICTKRNRTQTQWTRFLITLLHPLLLPVLKVNSASWHITFRFTSFIGICIQPSKANSAFHPSGVGKWVLVSAGKAKAGMFHSVSGWTWGVQVKLYEFPWERVPTVLLPYVSALDLRCVHDEALYKSTFTLPYLTHFYS